MISPQKFCTYTEEIYPEYKTGTASRKITELHQYLCFFLIIISPVILDRVQFCA